ncbi:hypothetical protein [Bremerella sp. P1]|uniref:hypothetical protein n=1 Tax=Bremerella sp. P1 TaxID=3026424 RepID=UPI002367A776|nr:hypothetical protein [Bremerella sp. P1]WDI41553.1 hypothetical protein PSR63_24115 [Bremerella sp. P1]
MLTLRGFVDYGDRGRIRRGLVVCPWLSIFQLNPSTVNSFACRLIPDEHMDDGVFDKVVVQAADPET